ncbi:MAG: hypothetical protein HRU20_17630 [Pseudomonadales bacterium]|nr:hypothetical protein [Pseudomonadales bacterium]
MNVTLLSDIKAQPKTDFYSSVIAPEKLAKLDFDLFTSLCELGTANEKICHLFQLEVYEFEALKCIAGR